MNPDSPKAEADEDKTSLLSVDFDERRNDSVAASPILEGTKKSMNARNNNGFLSAPLSAPIRPLSPDTLSNLSSDEFEQLGRRQSRRQQDGAPRRSSYSTTPHARGWKGTIERLWIRNKGLAYMLLAQIFGSLMNVTTRLLEIEGNKGKGLHPFQILFARMGITFVAASGYMWYTKTPYFPLGKPEVRWLLVARGLAGFLGVSGMYYSLLYLPLADATVITFLAPALACWACSILLKESFTRVEQIGTLVSMVGVVLIARPTSLFAAMSGGGDSPTANGGADAIPSGNSTAPGVSDASSYKSVTPMQRLSAVGVALIGVLGSSIVYTVIRWIGKRAHPLISVNYFAAWCFLVSIVMQAALPDVGFLLPADLKDWGYLIFLGSCGFVMQFLLAAGLSYEKSSRATNMVYTSMLFALFFDKVIFGHTPGIMSIIGSSLILGSAIIIALQQAPKKVQKESTNGRGAEDDEESRTGLMTGTRDVENSEDHERLPVHVVQLRTLR